MRPSLALSIGAVAAILFGLPVALAPAQMLEACGLGTSNEGLVLARDAGVLLIGLGIMLLLAGLLMAVARYL